MDEVNQSKKDKIALQSDYANSLSNKGPAILYQPIEFWIKRA